MLTCGEIDNQNGRKDLIRGRFYRSHTDEALQRCIVSDDCLCSSSKLIWNGYDVWLTVPTLPAYLRFSFPVKCVCHNPFESMDFCEIATWIEIANVYIRIITASHSEGGGKIMFSPGVVCVNGLGGAIPIMQCNITHNAMGQKGGDLPQVQVQVGGGVRLVLSGGYPMDRTTPWAVRHLRSRSHVGGLSCLNVD